MKKNENRRNVYILDGDWESIKEWAEKEDRSASNYLVHLHRDHIGFVEAENVQVEIKPRYLLDEVAKVEKKLQEEVLEIKPNYTVNHDNMPLPEKPDVIKEAREKIDGLINGKGYYAPRPKGKDGKKK